MKKIIFAALFAAAIFTTACSKEDIGYNGKDGETRRVVLDVQRTVESRGVGAPAGTQKVQFADGYVVFADGSNIATDVFTIVSGTPSADPADREITMAEGIISFEEVSAQSRNIYILGNAGALTITPETTNMETLVATLATAKSQTNAVSGSNLTAVNLYGKTASINHAVAPSTAAITVAPISSRIEIAKFTAGGTISGYKVEFIGINNFYHTSTLSGDLNKSALNDDKIYLGKDDADKFTADGIPAYATADAGYFYDENIAGGLGTLSGNVLADASGSWAYNLFAPVGGEFPHIVIRVSGVTGVTGLDASDIRYMTVTRFVNTSDDSQIAAFAPGKIYHIENIIFDETNLAVNPEMKTVTAAVTVTIPEWEPITVTPW